MKIINLRNVLLVGLIILFSSSYAQNNSVGIGTTTPDNSAILDLVSNNQGLLIPRNNTSGITSIAAPSDGLILYNTDDKCYWFWNNSAWKRLCETDSLLTLVNNLGDTIGFIYDSLNVHNNYISNLYDSVDVINNSITNLTTIVNNHSDSLGWIYDSLSVYNNLVNTNITNITNNTTNIQNLSDSLGWVYDSLNVHQTLITINTTNISNLYDSVDVINTHLGVVDSTLLNKWDIYGNVGTNPTTNFLGTIDNQHLVFRTNNTEKVRVTTTGRVGIGTNNPTQLLDINSNALRLRTGATNNFVLTTDATGVGTWQDPSLNPILTTYITTTTAPLGNDWKLLGNAGTNAATNFLGTTDNVDLVFRTNNTEKVRVRTNGRVGIGTNAPTQLLDINSNALRLRTGATNNFVLTTDATGVGTWQDPSLNPILTTYITTTTAPLGNDWKLLGNAGTNPLINFLGTTDNVDLVFRTNNIDRGRISSSGSFLLNGTTGTVPLSGAGTRLMWIPSRQSFRAGVVSSTQWDLANVGSLSFGFGQNTIASGAISFSVGQNTTASGFNSYAFGTDVIANNWYSYAFGWNSTASGQSATAMGDNAIASGGSSFALSYSTASGTYSFAAGRGRASGQEAFAFGLNAVAVSTNDFSVGVGSGASGSSSVAFNSGQATHQGSFAIGNVSSNNIFSFSSSFPNGYRLFSNGALTTGVVLTPGSGTWASVSDVNKKTNISNLNYVDVLNKINSLEIKQWSYKSETIEGQDKFIDGYNDKGEKIKVKNEALLTKDIYHIGVMAQDFYKAFSLGTSEELITTLDLAGVSMAAIKGLIQKIEQLEEKIKVLENNAK